MNNKIETLLKRAAAQSASAEGDTSSIAFAARAFSSASEAEKSFDELKKKLVRVEKWNAHSGLSSFELFDQNGERRPQKEAAAKIGDFIRITLTGSGKSDWVKITNVEEYADQIVLTVQPSYNPADENADKTVTSHFFVKDSSNNFCLRKANEKLEMYVIGLNEISNTQQTNNLIETVRNVAAANLGHYLGIQKAEWTTFCENFLETEKQND